MIYVVETGHYVTSTCDLTEEQFDRFREMYEKYCKTYDVKEDLAEDGLLSNVPELFGNFLIDNFSLCFLAVKVLSLWRLPLLEVSFVALIRTFHAVAFLTFKQNQL